MTGRSVGALLILVLSFLAGTIRAQNGDAIDTPTPVATLAVTVVPETTTGPATEPPPAIMISPAAAFLPTAAPDRIVAGLGGGFAAVRLESVVGYLESLVRAEREIFEGFLTFVGSGAVGVPVARLETVTGGVYLMTDLGYLIRSGIVVGIRGYHDIFPDLVARLVEEGTGGESIDESYTVTLKATRILAGVAVERSVTRGSPFRLRLGAYAGPVFLASDLSYSLRMNLPTLGVDPLFRAGRVPYVGTGFAANLDLEAEWDLGRGLGAYAGVGYSLACVKQVQVDREVDLDADGNSDFRKGEVLRDADQQAVRFDLGGFKVGGGIRARF